MSYNDSNKTFTFNFNGSNTVTRIISNFSTIFKDGFYIGFSSGSAYYTTITIDSAYFCLSSTLVYNNKIEMFGTIGFYQVYINGIAVGVGEPFDPISGNTVTLPSQLLIDSLIEIQILSSTNVGNKFVFTVYYSDGYITYSLPSGSNWFAGSLPGLVISTDISSLPSTKIKAGSSWIWDYYGSNLVTFTNVIPDIYNAANYNTCP